MFTAFSNCTHWVEISVSQFSRSVVSNSFQPHGLWHTRPPYLSLTSPVYSDSPLRRWCHQTISSSVVPFASCPQSFPASKSFQVSQLFASGVQSILIKAIRAIKNTLWKILWRTNRGTLRLLITGTFKHRKTSKYGLLAVQWLEFSALTTRGPGLIPGWGSKIPKSMWPRWK